MNRYQYYVYSWTDKNNDLINDQKIQDDLNKLGGLGWRLVTIERGLWDGKRKVTAYLESAIQDER